MRKSWSFSPRNSNVESIEEDEKEAFQELPQVLEDVDEFLRRKDATPEEPLHVPHYVHALPKLLERVVGRYDSGRSRFGIDDDDDKSFLDAVDRISKLSVSCPYVLDQTTSALDKAMCFLEKQFCTLLEDPKSKPPKKSFSFDSHSDSLSSSSVFSAFSENDKESPRPPQSSSFPGQDLDEEGFPPNFSAHKISNLNKIATAMISADYKQECCMAFANYRLKAFKTSLQGLGYGTPKMEDLYKMPWESLEAEIVTWIKLVQHCTTNLFEAERRLYNSIFTHHPSVSDELFHNLARAVIVNFLNFAQGVALTKPSTEKLFKFLDMLETLSTIGDSYSKEIEYETVAAKERIVEAASAMFCDLENSIKSDNERIPVPNGAVHPLTRYVMNYLKYACEYKNTLEDVLSFPQCVIVNHNIANDEEDSRTPKNSPFAIQLMKVMDLLDENIERKSKVYKDPSLRYIFLMNNGRYIVQKIKGCKELHECMGDNWCRRRQSGLRLYHKCYQRETWSKVLKCLNHEGLQGTGNKLSKQLLKERFKTFNSMFEDIHKSQSSWTVSDEQLQSELRVSISALVIPAYRSFVGRFKHHLESSSRHVDKYIKYHPEDIEALIDDLFDGNASSMGKKKT
ncbi:hypothetical protein RJT34_07805 [Clitoria ternatea]|uniref:Exocyst subunit Exo70 family protein n=1 Tax=Clitoria ternatea TaxID=43366 RepID=A0AAN9K306_CLITE